MMSAKTEIVRESVNGLEFYCEIRGHSGPYIALIPSGEGDCGSFQQVADTLAEDFTVFTLDMRGCSRTDKHDSTDPVTPELLASDIAGLISTLGLSPITVYGCSSGGQACLSLGLYHKHLLRNIIVHEVALLKDAPGSNGRAHGEEERVTTYFTEAIDSLVKLKGSKAEAMSALLYSLVGDEAAFRDLGQEYHDRIRANGETWIDYYLPHAGNRSYTQRELLAMPPIIFSASMLTPAWIAESNRAVAEKAYAKFTWMPPPCKHFPQVSNPDLLVSHIRNNTVAYL